FDVTALVFTPFNRQFALWIIMLTGLPLLLSLLHAARRLLRLREQLSLNTGRDTVWLALLALSGSWLGWFVLFSVGVPRYLFPAIFFGSMFVSSLLSDLTGQFDVGATLNNATAVLRRRFSRRAAAAWLAIGLLAFTVPITLLTLNNYYLSNTNTAALEVA